MKIIDVTGQKFGKLTVVKRVGTKHRQSLWLCKCDCGNVTEVILSHLKRGVTTSCGCRQKEVRRINGLNSNIGERNLKHGDFGTKLYGVWAAMIRRCSNPNTKHYKHYGARGITVCDNWRNDYSQFKSWAISNGYREGLTIDRVDVNGNYEPSNCRWVDMKTQANNRRNNLLFNDGGENLNITQLSNKYNLKYTTIHERYRKGQSFEMMIKPISN